ncbi:MAG: hypothetical protein KAI83_16855 [Thiomargarita sp.]|nr:hypothetical protein [Thiomargarita sp.]
MKNKRYLIGMACVTSLVFGMSAYAVKPVQTDEPANTDESTCGLTTITLGDGSKYCIGLSSHEGNTWEYSVSEISGKSLSHWNLGIPSCIEHITEHSPEENYDITDGSTGFEGIKWDVNESFTEGRFTITLDGDYPEITILAQAKAGTAENARTGEVKGPDCSVTPDSFTPDSFTPDNVTPDMEVCDYIYAVHDKGLNDSQIVRYHPSTGIEPLGPSREGYDIEGVEITLNGAMDGVMYGAGSDHGQDPGMLYEIDMATGEIIDESKVCNNGLDGISFNPRTNELWGWSETDGLVNLEKGCETVIPPEANFEVEDLSWNNAGDVLYFVYNVGSNPNSNDASKPHGIGKYVSETEVVEWEVCNFEASEIEALEVDEEGNLLVGFHDHGTQLVTVINPETCAVSGGIEVVKYNDIEAIAVCPPEPSEE